MPLDPGPRDTIVGPDHMCPLADFEPACVGRHGAGYLYAAVSPGRLVVPQKSVQLTDQLPGQSFPAKTGFCRYCRIRCHALHEQQAIYREHFRKSLATTDRGCDCNEVRDPVPCTEVAGVPLIPRAPKPRFEIPRRQDAVIREGAPRHDRVLLGPDPASDRCLRCATAPCGCSALATEWIARGPKRTLVVSVWDNGHPLPGNRRVALRYLVSSSRGATHESRCEVGRRELDCETRVPQRRIGRANFAHTPGFLGHRIAKIGHPRASADVLGADKRRVRSYAISRSQPDISPLSDTGNLGPRLYSVA
jgi:hypothetical protein